MSVCDFNHINCEPEIVLDHEHFDCEAAAAAEVLFYINMGLGFLPYLPLAPRSGSLRARDIKRSRTNDERHSLRTPI